jgi:hypothetical protein
MTSPDLAPIDRRAFLGGLGLSVLAAPLDVEAQRPGKIARIGYLSASAPAERVPVVRIIRKSNAVKRPRTCFIGKPPSAEAPHLSSQTFL